MSIKQLVVDNFRNITHLECQFDKRINFILGANGSGKSSFLETLYFLSHGKSFRTANIENIVLQQQQKAIVFARDSAGNRFGISKERRGVISLSVNGEHKTKLSDLARCLAVQVMTPESFRLFFGGPKERRRFISLGMFHVKQPYGQLNTQFNRVLKQRNALLKARQSNLDELGFWTSQFCQLSNQLAALCADYIGKLTKLISNWLLLLLPDAVERLSITFYNGWSTQGVELQDVLIKQAAREKTMGFSIAGAHKFDLKLELDGKPVEVMLSRGQQKLLLIALVFAQSELIASEHQSPPIIMVDDIGAELDELSKSAFAEAILKSDAQLFVSAIDQASIQPIINRIDDFSMFHVKHGEFKAAL